MQEYQNQPVIKDVNRRRAIKTIVGGVTAVAAYNIFPINWETPIIEQMFLPAHAATSATETSSAAIEHSLELRQIGTTGAIVVTFTAPTTFHAQGGGEIVTYLITNPSSTTQERTTRIDYGSTIGGGVLSGGYGTYTISLVRYEFGSNYRLAGTLSITITPP